MTTELKKCPNCGSNWTPEEIALQECYSCEFPETEEEEDLNDE